jgi:hypothetical protein
MNVLKQAIGLTLLILGLSLLPRAADAVHSWGNYHWEQSNSSTPVALNLGDNVDANWDVHLVLASEDWSVSVVIDTIVVAGSTRPRQCKTQTGNVQVCNDTYGNNGWLGIAGIAVSGDHITAAYVKVNDTYFDTQPYTTDPWRQYVMCQEIGHTFGLGHVNENFNNTNTGSCMDYTSDPAGISQGEDNTTPNQHDYTLLAEIYDGHDVSGGGGGGGDGGSGCNPRAPWCNGVSAADVLAGIEANGPRQWGRLISEHGPQEVYEIDLGRGEKIITHVLWTLERANDHEH